MPLSDKVTLAHGGGGVETEAIVKWLFRRLVPREFWKTKDGYGLDVLDDGAAIKIDGVGYLVVSTDSFTVSPPFFPGGDIGHLAASGTINDILMMGARPVAALDAIVVEEGFPLSELERIVKSMVKVFVENNVAVVGGDFKVMPKGSLDKIVISTIGIGVTNTEPIIDKVRPGDKIIVTGPIAEHGITILALRMGVQSSELRSDSKPLTDLMIPLVDQYRNVIHAARDPTRGGLAMALNDWARESNLLIVVDEQSIPIREPVRAYAEMLGVDPLALACEGVALLAVEGSAAEEVLDFIHGLGYRQAAIIGEVRQSERFKGKVVLKTSTGGLRIIDPPSGEIVPRIC
ncbi:MAG TPA: hydrogenase expression/formation protein HypE [Pyrodictiaceae archaeon]|nr:hydrogenase expression/formation protein HypE [Pyrodictiaceae archaeon]HIQ10785.1 hydrogenase expression/formation protein HypE [Pyrodictium sp.]HIQ55551.1 hydrogenase expression/formation protein HypE [Pyrodictium sp.]